MYARYIPPPKKATNTNSWDSGTARPNGTILSEPEPDGHTSAKTSVVAQPRKIIFTDDDFPEPEPKKRKQHADYEHSFMNDKGKKPKESRLGGQDQGESDQPRKKKHPDKDKENTGEENINGDGTGLAERAEGTRKSKKKKERTVVDDDTEPQLEPKSAQHAIPSDTKKREKKKDKNKVKKGAERRDEDGHGSDSLDESQKKHKAVFERKEKSLKRRAAVKASDDVNKAPGETTGDGEGGAPPDEAVEVHGLEPLPQPDPVNFDGVKPSYETLPPWLAHPIRVAPSTTAPFTDLGVSPDAARVLAAKGYKEAFAVQTAAIPLLLPSPGRQGDVVVAAATGSGKTLAYVLPMVRDISEGVVTRLRGLIVVPTRELVRQAQESCELCAGVFSGPGRKRVRVGISMGSQTLRQEQAALMEEEQVYDPAGYEAWKRANETVDIEDPEDELPTPAGPANVARPLPNHVIRHVSKVDILICTPGRLVEHIKQTPGFTLDYVRWLVVDEADKLLSQSFQQWLDVVLERLSTEKPGARPFSNSTKSGVRKVVLSATMTRDLSLLNSLKLQRPKLVVLEGPNSEDLQEGRGGVEGEHVLPGLLKEAVVKVRSPNLKPLYLLGLLQNKIMGSTTAEVRDGGDGALSADQSSESSGSEDSSSSSSDSEADDDDDDDDDDRSTSSSDSETSTPRRQQFKPDGPRRRQQPAPSSEGPTVLIFTRSNEAALRLSRLMALLSPAQLAPQIGTLASTARTSQRRRTLRAFAARRLRVLVASDLVARGLDLPHLDHVVNYDVPASAAAYVHRVGRTARAGRPGCAWTLVTGAEAAWFWREIGGEGKGDGAGKLIRRARKVERVRVDGDGEEEKPGRFSEEKLQRYEQALEQLGREASEMRRKGR